MMFFGQIQENIFNTFYGRFKIFVNVLATGKSIFRKKKMQVFPNITVNINS